MRTPNNDWTKCCGIIVDSNLIHRQRLQYHKISRNRILLKLIWTFFTTIYCYLHGTQDLEDCQLFKKKIIVLSVLCCLWKIIHMYIYFCPKNKILLHTLHSWICQRIFAHYIKNWLLKICEFIAVFHLYFCLYFCYLKSSANSFNKNYRLYRIIVCI